MSNPVFRALVRKELVFAAPISVMTIVAGLVAMGLTYLGRMGVTVGGILFITASLASGIFLALYAVAEERKHFARQFALSLPISGFELDLSKVVGLLLAWLWPWVVLTTLVLLGVLLHDGVPDGLVVYVLLVQGCILAAFCVFMSTVLVSRSDGVSGAAILVTNMAFSLFMVVVNQPPVREPMNTDAIVFTPFATGWLVADVLIAVGSLSLAIFFLSRKRDHV